MRQLRTLSSSKALGPEYGFAPWKRRRPSFPDPPAASATWWSHPAWPTWAGAVQREHLEDPAMEAVARDSCTPAPPGTPGGHGSCRWRARPRWTPHRRVVLEAEMRRRVLTLQAAPGCMRGALRHSSGSGCGVGAAPARARELARGPTCRGGLVPTTPG